MKCNGYSPRLRMSIVLPFLFSWRVFSKNVTTILLTDEAGEIKKISIVPVHCF